MRSCVLVCLCKAATEQLTSSRVAGLDWHVVMKKEQNDDDKTLFLAWVFGESRWFARMLSRVAHKATLDGSGNLLDAHGQPWKDQNLPPAILGKKSLPLLDFDCSDSHHLTQT